jgi:hypothetical protein
MSAGKSTLAGPPLRKRAVRLVAMLMLATLAMAIVDATPADAGITGSRVTSTGGVVLKVRTNPSAPNAPVVAVLGDGTGFTAECAVRARSVSGNTVWLRISAPSNGWIGDLCTNTPGFNQYLAGELDCNAPAPTRESWALAWTQSALGPTHTNGDLGDSHYPRSGWCAIATSSRAGHCISGSEPLHVSFAAHYRGRSKSLPIENIVDGSGHRFLFSVL